MAFIPRISSCLLLMLIGLAPASADSPKDPGTQLAFAASAGTVNEVKEQLKAGADPNHAANASGVPALSLAALRRDLPMQDVIKALLDAKADINIEDKQGQTPLFYAAQSGNLDAVKLLLAHGADAYHVDHQQFTARDAAFKADHKESVQVIDTFLKSRSASVMQQYADQNKTIEQRNQQIAAGNASIAERNKQLAQRSDAIEKQNAEIKAKLTRQKDMPQKTADAPGQAPVSQTQKNMDIGELQSLVYELSYHTCAAEYWRFCRGNKQDTGMDRQELRNQMEAHKTLADAAALKMRKDFGATDDYLQKVSAPSSQQIYDALARYGSNADRKEEGIGTKKDLDTRCADVADQWELVKPGGAGVPDGLKRTETDEDKDQDKNQPNAKPDRMNGLPTPQSRKIARPKPRRTAPKTPAPAQPAMQPNGMPRANTQILP